jgi:hypothetical protein
VFDKGDILDGKLIRQVHMGAEGLDGNQIAMEVNFEDGTDAIYVATLIPEPGTIGLLIVGCGLLVIVVRRARAAPAKPLAHRVGERPITAVPDA